MRLLGLLDAGDYTEDMPVLERQAVRAVIFENGKLALQQSAWGAYKFPGGGMEKGETHAEALFREVREETGLLIRPESLQPMGELREIRRDIFQKEQKYVAHSYYYLCAAEDAGLVPRMTAHEEEEGYHLIWESPETAYAANKALESEAWMERDTVLLAMLIKGNIDEEAFAQLL